MRQLPTRIVGLDWGVARIGVALSDERKIIATPLKTIKTEKKAEDTVKKILADLLAAAKAQNFTIEAIVVGMPFMMSGKAGFQADEVTHFINLFKEQTDIPILQWDERLTTSMAERSLKESSLNRKKRAQVVDSIAAILILQNYLDHISLKRLDS